MFRKLREALKKQRYRVHSDDVALPEVHTGQVTHGDAPETPEKHKSINYENVAIPGVHIPKKKPFSLLPLGEKVAPQGRMRGELARPEIFRAAVQFSPPPASAGAPSQRGPRDSKTPLTVRSGAFCP